MKAKEIKKLEARKPEKSRKPFVEPRIERHGRLPLVTGGSIPPAARE